MSKKYNDKNYTFFYRPIIYKNNFSPYLECLRNEMWDNIINHMINIIKKKKIQLKSGKKKFKNNINK